MDAFLDLSLDEDLQTCFQAIDRNNDPKAQKHILGSQYTVIGTSDGGGRPHTADRHETSTNLLGHWVREQQVMTLEEAVYRLTGKTALMHDITDRGFIAAGKVADITIFDPDTIASKPREPVATLPARRRPGQARRGRHRLRRSSTAPCCWKAASSPTLCRVRSSEARSTRLRIHGWPG